jgi:hypothetical protein
MITARRLSFTRSVHRLYHEWIRQAQSAMLGSRTVRRRKNREPLDAQGEEAVGCRSSCNEGMSSVTQVLVRSTDEVSAAAQAGIEIVSVDETEWSPASVATIARMYAEGIPV